MNIQRLIDYISVAFTAGYSILLIAVFYLAYFDPTSTVTICVDTYGEASIEFVLVSLSVPFVIYQIVGDTRRIRDAYADYRAGHTTMDQLIRRIGDLNNRTYLLGIVTIGIGVVLFVLTWFENLYCVAAFVWLGLLQIKIKVEEADHA